jgi:hypothetical protein
LKKGVVGPSFLVGIFPTCLCVLFVLVQTSIIAKHQKVTFDSIPGFVP